MDMDFALGFSDQNYVEQIALQNITNKRVTELMRCHVTSLQPIFQLSAHQFLTHYFTVMPTFLPASPLLALVSTNEIG